MGLIDFLRFRAECVLARTVYASFLSTQSKHVKHFFRQKCQKFSYF